VLPGFHPHEPTCLLLALGWAKALAGHRLVTAWLGSSSAGKALGAGAVSWTGGHSMSWRQGGPKASHS